MTFMTSKLDRMLADTLGEDDGLRAELRAHFLASATELVAALSTAQDATEWRDAALRLQGLAASFGMTDLMVLAGEATRQASSPPLLAAIARALATCR
jgi:hypothetical protein